MGSRDLLVLAGETAKRDENHTIIVCDITHAIQRNDAEIGFYQRVLPPPPADEPQMAMAGAIDSGDDNQFIPAAGAPADDACGYCNDTGTYYKEGVGVVACCGTGASGLYSTTYAATCYCQSYKSAGPGTPNIDFGGVWGTITDMRGATTISDRNDVVSKYSKWVAEIDTPEGASLGAGVGNHGFIMFDEGGNNYYGAAGLDTCIGVAMHSARGRFIAGFHFSTGNNETATINQYKYPEDTIAVIAGGTNGGASVHQLYRTISALKRNKIRVVGVVDGDAVFFDTNGKIFTRGKHLIGEYTRASEVLKSDSTPKND